MSRPISAKISSFFKLSNGLFLFLSIKPKSCYTQIRKKKKTHNLTLIKNIFSKNKYIKQILSFLLLTWSCFKDVHICLWKLWIIGPGLNVFLVQVWSHPKMQRGPELMSEIWVCQALQNPTVSFTYEQTAMRFSAITVKIKLSRQMFTTPSSRESRPVRFIPAEIKQESSRAESGHQTT